MQKSSINISKWQPISRSGAFVGFIFMHYTQLSLVINLNTLSIYTQYHVVFDDGFTSVTSIPETTPKIWKYLITLPNNKL